MLTIQTEGKTSILAAADFNADGRMDVVLTRDKFMSAETFKIEILLNDGNGSFRVGTSEVFDGPITKSQFPGQLLVDDFNGDGRPDIFIADSGQDANPFPGYQNQLVLSSPGGKLIDATGNLPQQNDFSHSAASADIDGDGDVDLFVGNTYGQNDIRPYILLNDGTGVFSIDRYRIPGKFTNFSIGKYTSSRFVDVNGDGFSDLILGADSNTPSSAVLLNDGTGYFSELPNAIPTKPWENDDINLFIEPQDFDNNGLPDLIMSFTTPNYIGRYLQILINNGDGTFIDETDTRLPPQFKNNSEWVISIKFVDLNGDGFLDITTNTMGGKPANLPLYLNDGNGFFSKSPYKLRDIEAWQYVFIDLDGDGGLDILSSVTPWLDDMETIAVRRDIGCE
jgi:hypothetical protein